MKRALLISLALGVFGGLAVATILQMKIGSGAPPSLIPGELAVATNTMMLYAGNATSNAVPVGGAGFSTTNETRDVSFSNVTVNGNITLSNTVWDDCRVALSTARAGASVPNYSAMTNGVYAWHFVDGQTDILYFEVQLPHRYKHGTDLNPHLHWAATSTDTNAVVWELEYTVASIASNYPAAVSLVMTTPCPGVVNQHTLSSFGTISGAGVRASAVLVGAIKRLGTSGGDAYPDAAIPLSFDLHFQSDKLGSDDEIPGP